MPDSVPVQLVEVKDEKKASVSFVERNKKIILWGILIVLGAVILYVLFGDRYKQYRLATETRANLKGNVLSDTSSAPILPNAVSATSPAFVMPLTQTANSTELIGGLSNLFKSY